MRAVGYRKSLPITEAEALVDLDLPQPEPGPRDLLVKVEAVSVNPVDTKVRLRAEPEAGGVKVLGWDAAGTVVAKGAEAEGFSVGDAVFYAGDLTRPGTNAEFHCVDARIVGHKPARLDWAQAAALPRTARTAREALFDRRATAQPGPGAAPARRDPGKPPRRPAAWHGRPRGGRRDPGTRPRSRAGTRWRSRSGP